MSKRGGSYWVIHGLGPGGGPWTGVSEMYTASISQVLGSVAVCYATSMYPVETANNSIRIKKPQCPELPFFVLLQ